MRVRKTIVIPAKAGIQKVSPARGGNVRRTKGARAKRTSQTHHKRKFRKRPKWDTNQILLIQVLRAQLFTRNRNRELPYHCVRR